MAEIDGKFPVCTETKKKGSSEKKKTDRLKQKLECTEYKLKFQKKIYKERIQRCKAETELKLIKQLLQNHGTLPESYYTLHKRK